MGLFVRRRGLRMGFVGGLVGVVGLVAVGWAFAGSALAAGGSGLIDGRGWELVSPPNKHGAPLEPANSFEEGGAIQAAEDGGAIAYFARAPVEASPAGNTAPFPSEILSRRGEGGWSSQDIATPHEEVVNIVPTNREAEYLLFSPDLSAALVEPFSSTPLPPLGAGAERTLYLRDDSTGSYLPLVTTENVPSGAKFGGSLGSRTSELIFQGASPDLSHVVFSSPEALTANTVRDEVPGSANLYEWVGGQLRLVSVLPPNAEGKERSASEEGEFAGLGYSEVHPHRVTRAVSADGSRVAWEARKLLGLSSLYVRDMVKGESVLLSIDGTFQTASEDGSRVFFTDGDLNVFEAPVGGALSSGVVRDLTPGGGVLGVLPEASEDGSYVYFVATGDLAAGASVGEPNLYMEHYDGAQWLSPRLVAVLSPEDEPDYSRAQLQPLAMQASRDGRYLAFMSDRSLTGYDNRDAASGASDEEVYLYDAAAGSSGRVVCVSCDTTDARPMGIFAPKVEEPGGHLLADRGGAWEGRWLGGNVPEATDLNGSLLYHSSYLADSGRLFFDSPGALVPADVNGKEDVYEYEPVGVGGCQESTQGTTVVFSRAAGGCVGLISSGASSEESVFMDASRTGGDAFFLTAARLTSADVDSGFDLYDAHECLSLSPCMGASEVVSPPCASAEACRGSGLAPAVLGAPVTAGVTGVGNASVPPAAAPVVGRSLSRAQKLAQALKACRKKPRHKRVACEGRARRTYKATSARAGGASPVRSGR
jgi:hypothetical protein